MSSSTRINFKRGPTISLKCYRPIIRRVSFLFYGENLFLSYFWKRKSEKVPKFSKNCLKIRKDLDKVPVVSHFTVYFEILGNDFKLFLAIAQRFYLFSKKGLLNKRLKTPHTPSSYSSTPLTKIAHIFSSFMDIVNKITHSHVTSRYIFCRLVVLAIWKENAIKNTQIFFTTMQRSNQVKNKNNKNEKKGTFVDTGYC